MDRVKMLTVVPATMAEQLKNKKRIEDYNTLPQLGDVILEVIREYMTKHVGYSYLPMACLVSNGKDIDGTDIMNYLPINGKTSILFQLEMPADMIISVKFDDLLDIAENVKDSESDLERKMYLAELDDLLCVGISQESSEEQISFIPFLDIDKCKFYAKFDSDFRAEELHLDVIDKLELKRITSFIN